MTTPPRRILICATHVPFTYGGAEYLVEGLHDALVAQGHMVDVIRLPFAWQPPQCIADSALAWRLLDISSVNGMPIDQVICTKFPSYLVRHPCKVTWLVHQHRQAYDWYGTPMSDFVNTPEYRQVRALIFQMDRRGLGESCARYAISQNVSQRLARFNQLSSTVLYPPSRYAPHLRSGNYGNYLLSAARLDRAKRLDLLLMALAQTHSPIQVLFAGSGPDEARLKTLAASLGLGDRVKFFGFVDDATLIDLYAYARAVYYAPIDEDYGFATVEALGAERPVITTHDAGGVLEFVEDGINGCVSPPHADAIAANLDRLWDDDALVARLGQAGPSRVATITWERVTQALVDDVVLKRI